MTTEPCADFWLWTDVYTPLPLLSATHKIPSFEKASPARNPSRDLIKKPSCAIPDCMNEISRRSGLCSLPLILLGAYTSLHTPCMCFEPCPRLAAGLKPGITACCVRASCHTRRNRYVRRQAMQHGIAADNVIWGRRLATAMQRSTLCRRSRVPRPPQHEGQLCRRACHDKARFNDASTDHGE